MLSLTEDWILSYATFRLGEFYNDYPRLTEASTRLLNRLLLVGELQNPFPDGAFQPARLAAYAKKRLAAMPAAQRKAVRVQPS
jgi:hypothetical protein